jgi:hypothetical protein
MLLFSDVMFLIIHLFSHFLISDFCVFLDPSFSLQKKRYFIAMLIGWTVLHCSLCNEKM